MGETALRKLARLDEKKKDGMDLFQRRILNLKEQQVVAE